MSSGFTEYNNVWLQTDEARVLQDLTTSLNVAIPDITNNSLGSFGFIHDNYHVKELRLFQSYFNPDCQLRELPESIGNLSLLQRLDISHNMLEHLPDSIAELEELTSCYLDYNNFRRFPETLLHLEDLRQLNFDENQLGHIPEKISQVKYLQSLHLAGNYFKEFPEELANLLYLRRLDLSRNQIHSLDYMLLDKFSQLYVLDLRGNVITQQEISKAQAYLKLVGKKRRKYYLQGQMSSNENPFSLHNLKKRIQSDPFLTTPETEEELIELANHLKITHELKYGPTEGILN